MAFVMCVAGRERPAVLCCAKPGEWQGSRLWAQPAGQRLQSACGKSTLWLVFTCLLSGAHATHSKLPTQDLAISPASQAPLPSCTAHVMQSAPRGTSRPCACSARQAWPSAFEAPPSPTVHTRHMCRGDAALPGEAASPDPAPQHSPGVPPGVPPGGWPGCAQYSLHQGQGGRSVCPARPAPLFRSCQEGCLHPVCPHRGAQLPRPGVSRDWLLCNGTRQD